jgi:hypothetical protein
VTRLPSPSAVNPQSSQRRAPTTRLWFIGSSSIRHRTNEPDLTFGATTHPANWREVRETALNWNAEICVRTAFVAWGYANPRFLGISKRDSLARIGSPGPVAASQGNHLTDITLPQRLKTGSMKPLIF